MDGCRSQHYKKLLYAYELGLLDEEQRRELELHILECEYCQNELKEFEQNIVTLRRSSRVRDTVEQISDQGTDEHEASLPKPSPSAEEGSRRIMTIGALIAAAAVFIFLILNPWNIQIQPTKEAIAEENRIAVVYFENLVDESDPKNLGKILTNLLITDLSQSQYVQVISSQHLYDILKLLGKEDVVSIDRDLATEIAREARAKWILLGSVIQTEPKLALTVQLIDITSGDIVVSRRVEEASDEDIFGLVDRLTVEVKRSLSLPAAAWNEPDPAIADVTTHSPEAYQAYLDGIKYYERLDFKEAYASYRKAVEYDSTFAIAYYCLAWPSDTTLLKKAVKYASKATRKEQLYIMSLDASLKGNIEQAKEYMRELIKLYPDEKSGYLELSGLEVKQGNLEGSIRNLTKAIEIDPLCKIGYNELAYAYNRIGKFDMAMQMVEKYKEIAPDEPNPYDTEGELLGMHGELDRAIKSYEKAYSIKPDFSNYGTLFTLGRLNVYKGNYIRARELFQKAASVGEREIRATARTYLALLPLYQGKLMDALGIIDDAIAADRMDQLGKSNLSQQKYNIKIQILLDLGRIAEARKVLSEANELRDTAAPAMGSYVRPLSVVFSCEEGDTVSANRMVKDIEKELSEDSTYENYYCRILQREFCLSNRVY